MFEVETLQRTKQLPINKPIWTDCC